MDIKKEFEETKEDSSCVKVKIEFEISLDDCVPKALNKMGLMLIQHGQALILANDSDNATIEENEECCLPFY